MPTLISESHSGNTARPKVITGLSKGSLIPPKHRNVYVVKFYFFDANNQQIVEEIQTRDQLLVTQLVQFAFQCESAYPKTKKNADNYQHVEGFEKFCGCSGQFKWPEWSGFVGEYAGFDAYFYDMNGTKTSLVINYND